MACGDRYKHLITTTSGFTVEHPFGTGLDAEIKGPGDYLEWYKLADHLVAAAYGAFVKLGEVEQERGSYPKWNGLVERNNAMIEAWDDLPYPFVQISPMFDVQKAVQVTLDAVCMLELANEGIESYGVIVDPVASLHKPSGKIDLLTLLILGGIAYVALGGGQQALFGGDEDG